MRLQLILAEEGSQTEMSGGEGGGGTGGLMVKTCACVLDLESQNSSPANVGAFFSSFSSETVGTCTVAYQSVYMYHEH